MTERAHLPITNAMDGDVPKGPLRRGWTTGACAAAAARAAYEALITGQFPDPVSIRLPRGETPAFALARQEIGEGFALAGIVKDAGDDPDVTHGVLVCAHVSLRSSRSGVVFKAGQGVGTITRPGLPLAPGEPAINPGPRKMIAEAIAETAARFGEKGDVTVEVSIPGGEAIALKTLNPRLGIVGGLSVLGTTGVVVPYSCSAWIHSIHRGIDVACAAGIAHIAGATGSTSEAAVKVLHNLPEIALIDMGDFVGGMLKYLSKHPVPRLTIAGGIAKMTKLGQGLLDLHSGRGEVDFHWLAQKAREAGSDETLVRAIGNANTAKEIFDLAAKAHIPLGEHVARAAWRTAACHLSSTMLEIVLFGREGKLVARTPFERADHGGSFLPRKRR